MCDGRFDGVWLVRTFETWYEIGVYVQDDHHVGDLATAQALKEAAEVVVELLQAVVVLRLEVVEVQQLEVVEVQVWVETVWKRCGSWNLRWIQSYVVVQQ